jgi:hypothetical protein
MADSDSNIIKPVESLQNVPVLNHVKRREQRKRRRQPREENKEYSEAQQDSLEDEQDFIDKLPESQDDENTIDYCA